MLFHLIFLNHKHSSKLYWNWKWKTFRFSLKFKFIVSIGFVFEIACNRSSFLVLVDWKWWLLKSLRLFHPICFLLFQFIISFLSSEWILIKRWRPCKCALRKMLVLLTFFKMCFRDHTKRKKKLLFHYSSFVRFLRVLE